MQSDPADEHASRATLLLHEAQKGSRPALDGLLPIVYDELRRVAAVVLRDERTGHTLQTTALVHEVYLKLIDQRSAGWKSKAQFMGIAAQAMRRILVDHARGKNAAKRGGGIACQSLDAAIDLSPEGVRGLVALDDALERLGTIDPAKAKVVSLKFFGGMSAEQIADVLGVSTRSVERAWAAARAWLHTELARPGT